MTEPFGHTGPPFGPRMEAELRAAGGAWRSRYANDQTPSNPMGLRVECDLDAQQLVALALHARMSAERAQIARRGTRRPERAVYDLERDWHAGRSRIEHRVDRHGHEVLHLEGLPIAFIAFCPAAEDVPFDPAEHASIVNEHDEHTLTGRLARLVDIEILADVWMRTAGPDDLVRAASGREHAVEHAWRAGVQFRVDATGERWLDGPVGPLAYLGWLALAMTAEDLRMSSRAVIVGRDSRPGGGSQ